MIRLNCGGIVEANVRSRKRLLSIDARSPNMGEDFGRAKKTEWERDRGLLLIKTTVSC